MPRTTYEPFHFRQFSVHHDQCGMKVGTDAVVLGAWTSVTGSRRILDIGTGSGVIALMLAQRTSTETIITGIDIQEADAKQAAMNFSASPWSARLEARHLALQDFDPESKFDLIVTNPPFFHGSLKAPEAKRNQSRHTVTLGHDDLLQHARRLLLPAGRLAVVLPVVEAEKLFDRAVAGGLFLRRRCDVHSRVTMKAERLLLEFSQQQGESTRESLILYDENHRSAAYQQLTEAFYR